MNASCASGIFLGACVYQCLLTHPSPPRVVSRPVAGRWSLGVASVFFLFFFSKKYVVDTGIPRRVDLHSKRASVVMCTFRLTLLGPIRCGCGKSVTRHHRQLEFHSSLASLMCAYQGTGFGRPSSADWFTPFQAHCSAPPSPHGEEDTSLGPDIHKRTR